MTDSKFWDSEPGVAIGLMNHETSRAALLPFHHMVYGVLNDMHLLQTNLRL